MRSFKRFFLRGIALGILCALPVTGLAVTVSSEEQPTQPPKSELQSGAVGVQTMQQGDENLVAVRVYHGRPYYYRPYYHSYGYRSYYRPYNYYYGPYYQPYQNYYEYHNYNNGW